MQRKCDDLTCSKSVTGKCCYGSFTDQALNETSKAQLQTCARQEDTRFGALAMFTAAHMHSLPLKEDVGVWVLTMFMAAHMRGLLAVSCEHTHASFQAHL